MWNDLSAGRERAQRTKRIGLYVVEAESRWKLSTLNVCQNV